MITLKQSQRLICWNCIFGALVCMAQRSFTIRLKKDEESGYYAARCVELPEVISQGRTEQEALDNVKEALELVLEEYESQAKKEGDKLIPIVV
jgi:predicted RNase H-like HicB family nuclease